MKKHFSLLFAPVAIFTCLLFAMSCAKEESIEPLEQLNGETTEVVKVTYHHGATTFEIPFKLTRDASGELTNREQLPCEHTALLKELMSRTNASLFVKQQDAYIYFGDYEFEQLFEQIYGVTMSDALSLEEEGDLQERNACGTVTLYKNINYGSSVFGSAANALNKCDLSTTTYNDAISSVKLTGKSTLAKFLTLYNNIGCTGSSLSFSVDCSCSFTDNEPNLGAWGFDNKASGFKIWSSNICQ